MYPFSDYYELPDDERQSTLDALRKLEKTTKNHPYVRQLAALGRKYVLHKVVERMLLLSPFGKYPESMVRSVALRVPAPGMWSAQIAAFFPFNEENLKLVEHDGHMFYSSTFNGQTHEICRDEVLSPGQHLIDGCEKMPRWSVQNKEFLSNPWLYIASLLPLLDCVCCSQMDVTEQIFDEFCRCILHFFDEDEDQRKRLESLDLYQLAMFGIEAKTIDCEDDLHTARSLEAEPGDNGLELLEQLLDLPPQPVQRAPCRAA